MAARQAKVERYNEESKSRDAEREQRRAEHNAAVIANVEMNAATAEPRRNAEWAAEHRPAVKAAQKAQAEPYNEESKLREMRAQVAAQAVAEREQRRAEDNAPAIANVEINTATAAQLAKLQWMDAEVARQIVAERLKRRFDSWTDLVKRVDALSTVETAMRASAFGLTVNGSSLKGAEPTSSMARYMRRWRVEATTP